MHDYRLYTCGGDGELIGPGIQIRADDDEAAIQVAKNYINGLAAELCDGVRIVQRFNDEE
jgi:hypothetical protein